MANLFDVSLIEKARDVEIPSANKIEITYNAVIDGMDKEVRVEYYRGFKDFTVFIKVTVTLPAEDIIIERHRFDIRNKQAFNRATEFWMQALLKHEQIVQQQVDADEAVVDDHVNNIT